MLGCLHYCLVPIIITETFIFDLYTTPDKGPSALTAKKLVWPSLRHPLWNLCDRDGNINIGYSPN